MKTRVLISAEEVAQRVTEMAEQISRYYDGREFAVIALGNGAVFFAVDLCRKLQGNFTFDYVAVSSYEDNSPSGKINLRCPPKIPFAGREVLLVDDVLDTGHTLSTLHRWFTDNGAASVRSAVLADKEQKRHPDAVDFNADWSGFKVPNLYLIGCGMDVDEHLRQLPCIVVKENE